MALAYLDSKLLSLANLIPSSSRFLFFQLYTFQQISFLSFSTAFIAKFLLLSCPLPFLSNFHIIAFLVDHKLRKPSRALWNFLDSDPDRAIGRRKLYFWRWESKCILPSRHLTWSWNGIFVHNARSDFSLRKFRNSAHLLGHRLCHSTPQQSCVLTLAFCHPAPRASNFVEGWVSRWLDTLFSPHWYRFFLLCSGVSRCPLPARSWALIRIWIDHVSGLHPNCSLNRYQRPQFLPNLVSNCRGFHPARHNASSPRCWHYAAFPRTARKCGFPAR